MTHFRHPDRSEAEWRDLFCQRSMQWRREERSLDFASLRSASLGMTGFCHMRSPYPNGGEEYEKGRAALQSVAAYQLGDRSVGH